MNDSIDLTTRRQFLRDSSLLAASLLVPAGTLARTIGAPTTSLEQIGFGTFAANAGTTFWVLQDQAPAIGLQLARAQASPPPANVFQTAAADAGNEKFSLFFRGWVNQALDQDTYIFEHGRIGRFAMFIVPIGLPAAGYQIYQAVFNRPAGVAGLGGPLGRRATPRTGW